MFLLRPNITLVIIAILLCILWPVCLTFSYTPLCKCYGRLAGIRVGRPAGLHFSQFFSNKVYFRVCFEMCIIWLQFFTVSCRSLLLSTSILNDSYMCIYVCMYVCTYVYIIIAINFIYSVSLIVILYSIMVLPWGGPVSELSKHWRTIY